MLLIRPVCSSDLGDLVRLAAMAGSGMTSLQPNPETLSEKIAVAEATFQRNSPDKLDEFLLVMEDTETRRVVGTSAVHARIGTRQAFYAYRLMNLTHYSHSLDREIRSGLLHLTNEYTDCSEVGTLFLDPDARGNGHWLSRSRYMLMAQHRDRFANDVIAEMRGWVDEAGKSPFWDAIGAHFFEMSYDEADRLCGSGSNQFITELMPKYPIYTNLLPADARDVIGKPQPATRRAMELLLAEGFEFENLIDIFDGGPLLRGRIDRLKSIQAASKGRVRVGDPGDPGDAQPAMVANQSLVDFRLMFQPMKILGEEWILPPEVCEQLQVADGDEIMMMPGAI